MTKYHLLAVAFLIGAPAFAQDTAPAAKIQPDRKVCREQGETGTRMTRRICHTAAEWTQIDTQIAAERARQPRMDPFASDRRRRN